jgi:peptidoglycan/xylan/chitin deacetylase (PgdA/CDA1 family)
VIRRGTEGLRRIARWRRNRSGRGALILLYHRLTKSRSDPWALSVRPSHFAEHLEVLREHARPTRLQRLSEVLLDENLPDRSVVVTFDDGYADNLHSAKPLLERYDVPATIFLTSGFTGHGREFWWDELDRILLQPGTLPERLNLSINGGLYRGDLGEAAHWSEEASWHHRKWTIHEKAPSPRHSLYRSLWELLNPLTEGERRGVLDELLTWAGAELASHPRHRLLSLEEVSVLAQGELIEVGAHTVTHPRLSALPAASQRDEIRGSKARLEEVLNRPVTSFAYPHGGRSDYTAQTVSIVREAGFARACSNFAGVVGPSTDRFQLPRIHVQDWDGDEFARRLSRWFWLSRWFHD